MRLYPLKLVISKHLLRTYEKPIIYCPFSTLMLAVTVTKDIFIILTPQDSPNFEKLLDDGSRFGINRDYAEQASQNGLE